MASLYGFINKTEVPMTLMIPKELTIPFSGWYLDYYPHVIEKVQSGMLKIDVQFEKKWYQIGEE